MILNQPSIYLQTGYNSVIFPNVTVGEGFVVGAPREKDAPGMEDIYRNTSKKVEES